MTNDLVIAKILYGLRFGPRPIRYPVIHKRVNDRFNVVYVDFGGESYSFPFPSREQAEECHRELLDEIEKIRNGENNPDFLVPWVINSRPDRLISCTRCGERLSDKEVAMNGREIPMDIARFAFKARHEDCKEPVAEPIEEDPIHLWFGLSYASYLVIPRAVLQSMPHDWQSRLITLLGEMNDTIDWMPEGCGYDVGMVTAEGRPTIDPNAHYRHRRLPRKK